MQTFIDTATQKVYQYEDDVVVTLKNGVYSFSTSFGTSLNTPSTLQPYTIPAPTPAQLLSEAQTAQIASLQAAFNTAMVAPVTVTLASGTSYSFATDTQSLKNLNESISANISNATWTPNFWYTASGSVATPVTYADLHAIAEGVQSFQVPDIQNLHTKIGEVLAATTVSAVQAITF